MAVTARCARRGGKTRVVTLTSDNYVSGETIAIFFVSWFSDVNATTQRKRCAEMWSPMSCCMCEPMETRR